MSDSLLQRLGITHPIVLAPMGGFSTPELVAAVSEEGGLGSVGSPYMTPDQIMECAGQIRALTSKPFAFNLFAGGYDSNPRGDPAPMLDLLSGIHAQLGADPPVLPKVPPDPFPAQLDAVIAARPAAFSFTFGVPGKPAMARLKSHGIFVMGTATTVQEAQILEQAGIDAIVAQGAEAGAHRGTFAHPFEEAMVPMRRLVREIAATVSVPVIAAGGIMDGRAIKEALQLGAAAAQLGTAFIPCPECSASDAHKRAILSARRDETAVTRAFSGRHARGIGNAFMETVERTPNAILTFPLQNMLTRPMRAAAAKAGDERFLSLWAGQGVANARAMKAADLVRTLISEMA